MKEIKLKTEKTLTYSVDIIRSHIVDKDRTSAFVHQCRADGAAFLAVQQGLFSDEEYAIWRTRIHKGKIDLSAAEIKKIKSDC